MTVTTATKPIRVMIVDDSALMRKLLAEMLSRSPGIEIVDTAMDGQFALDHLQRIRPDVILMDIEMPRLDGLATLEHIVAEYGLPVVMCSTLTSNGAQATLEALKRGAVDFIEKPSLAALTSGTAATDMAARVRGAAGARVIKSGPVQPKPAAPNGLRRTTGSLTPPHARTPLEQITRWAGQTVPEIAAIGISTGGPPALEIVLAALPADFPLGLAIVQHMPPGFTKMLAEQLNRTSRIEVREAAHGDLLHPGLALIAPGGAHLRVTRAQGQYRVAVDTQGPLVSGHRPSADVLFDSVAQASGGHAVAVLMTGMGSDGADGLGRLAAAGALTIAQAPDTCVVAGMPKSAIERGAARAILPLVEISAALNACGRPTEQP
ncbi:MAG: chemotaxis response regulator protein-glutamate methylesterase [Acidobacteria bacterium]|nr:chemotaxis response regulator protein-glutamate methylesterase [Acidobacteriota bacterium]